ncbi:MAG: serine/threonine-protein kinase [Myxococcota bacterium]
MGINRPFGDYMLLKRIASGGMAEIFLALKRGPGRFEKLVAIKAITGGRGDNELYLKMFQTEAEVAARFNHPHVVQLYDVAEIESAPCMIMEYMHGHTMAEVVEAAEQAGTSFPADLAVFLMMEVCEGLSYVHSLVDWSGEALGIVHRDVSPQNVMLTHDGVAKVFDFGIAQIGGASAIAGTEGSMAGKFGYMSPEQCRGELLDHRSDIFALGVMLWELTVGKPLFSDQDRFQIIRALTEDAPIPKPSEVADGYPRFLERIVMKALAKERTERYSSCEELRDDLAKYLKVSALKPNRKKATALMQQLFADDDTTLAELVRQAPRDTHSIAAAAAATAQRSHTHATAPPSGRVATMSAAAASQMAAEMLPDIDDDAVADRTLETDGEALVARAMAAAAEKAALAGVRDTPAIPHVSPDILGSDTPPTHVPAFIPMSSSPPSGRGNTALLIGLGSVIVVLLVAVVGLVIMLQSQPTPELPPVEAKAPAATTGKLHITSSPAGAAVELNGRRLSVTTPTTIPGIAFDEPVIVVLVKEGFESASETFTFSAEQASQTFQASLVAAQEAPAPKAVGSLRVVAHPAEANVFLDDVKVADSTPVTLNDITVGPEHTLRISHEGYDDAPLPFTIGRGELREIEVELAKVARPGVAVAKKGRFRFRVKREGETKEVAYETAPETTSVLRISDDKGDAAVVAKMEPQDNEGADDKTDPAAADTETSAAKEGGAADKAADSTDKSGAKADPGLDMPAVKRRKKPIEVKPVEKKRVNPALKEEPYPMMLNN